MHALVEHLEYGQWIEAAAVDADQGERAAALDHLTCGTGSTRVGAVSQTINVDSEKHGC